MQEGTWLSFFCSCRCQVLPWAQTISLLQKVPSIIQPVESLCRCEHMLLPQQQSKTAWGNHKHFSNVASPALLCNRQIISNINNAYAKKNNEQHFISHKNKQKCTSNRNNIEVNLSWIQHFYNTNINVTPWQDKTMSKKIKDIRRIQLLF